MVEDIVFSTIILFICFTFLYILVSIYYLFQYHNLMEKDMWEFYKNNIRNRKKKMRKEEE